MKKSEIFFNAILVPLDFVLIGAAGLSAYWLRFSSSVETVYPADYRIPFDRYSWIIALTAAVWVVIFAATGLYNMGGTRRIITELRKVVLACSTGVLVIIILFFFNRDLFSSRFIILVAYVFALVFVIAGRLLVLKVERTLFGRGVGVHHVALIGKGRVAEVICSELGLHPGLGLQVVFQAEQFNDSVSGRLRDLQVTGRLDEIIHADPDANRQQRAEVNTFCEDQHVIYKYAAALSDTRQSNITIQPIAGIPVIEVHRTRLDGWGRVVKRTFDVFGSLLLIVLTSPVMLLAAIAIVLDSGWPIFFSRRDDGRPVTRVGHQGTPFTYFKFRSMRTGTDSQRYDAELQQRNVRKDSPLVKIVDDPRITRVGAVLRRFSIDELPEFFLVLKGDMSLVGPRPHLPEEVANYQHHHRRVLSMKPGITGMAQISGRSDLDFEDEVRLDTFYMENWSVLLDLIILVKTPLVLFKRRTAL